MLLQLVANLKTDRLAKDEGLSHYPKATLASIQQPRSFILVTNS
ncbi:unnamed protein product, partial [marine sediment metagenome]